MKHSFKYYWIRIVETHKVCKTIGGAKVGFPCIFPFTYHEKKYNECIWNDVGAWCQTAGTSVGAKLTFADIMKTNSLLRFFRGFRGIPWGYCNADCPMAGSI